MENRGPSQSDPASNGTVIVNVAAATTYSYDGFFRDGYDPTATVGSFIGWGPVDDPQFIVLIKLDKPTSSIWGSETAAPVFSTLVKRLVVLMEIPPDALRHQLQAAAGN